MKLMPPPAEIRRLVLQTFCHYGAVLRDPLDLDETVRVDEGKLVARTYRGGELFAMWFVELGLLQFYDVDGNMLRTVNLFEELHPLPAAA